MQPTHPIAPPSAPNGTIRVTAPPKCGVYVPAINGPPRKTTDAIPQQLSQLHTAPPGCGSGTASFLVQANHSTSVTAQSWHRSEPATCSADLPQATAPSSSDRDVTRDPIVVNPWQRYQYGWSTFDSAKAKHEGTPLIAPPNRQRAQHRWGLGVWILLRSTAKY